MWMTLLQGVLNRPWIIAMAFMLIFMGYQWVNINSLKGDIVDLKDDIVDIRGNYNTCKTNEGTLNGALDSYAFQVTQFEQNIELLEGQIVKEKGRVVYWRDKYNNKICITCPEQTCENPTDVEVLTNESSLDVINRINTIFKP